MNTLDVLLHNKMINTTIAISPAVAKEALSFKIKRVEQVANGIPISLFHSINPQHSSSGSRARVVSVGRLSLEKKGQDVLIRAIKRCVDKGLDVDCTLVGSPASGDTTTLPMLTALVSELELTPRIHFVQGRSNVTALLGDADVFVLPSRHEGFGLALVEAMAAGLPVIASDIEGPANIVTDGEDGLLFEPGCDEQLAEKIGTVIQSSRFAQKLSDNARTTSRKYDISLMRDRYTGIYGRLIAQG